MRNPAIAVLMFLLCIGLSSCNGQANAQKAQQIIYAVFRTAQLEESAVPTADQAAYTNFVNLGLGLNSQLSTCISNVSGLTGKAAKFAACFNTFASGLLAPGELAQLRLLSPATQAKVQLYVTAAVAGINVIVSFAQPQIASQPARSAQLRALGHRAGLSNRELAQAGL